MSNGELYAGREQTLVKHFILQKYLERFAYIVGSHWDALTYVGAPPGHLAESVYRDACAAIGCAVCNLECLAEIVLDNA